MLLGCRKIASTPDRVDSESRAFSARRPAAFACRECKDNMGRCALLGLLLCAIVVAVDRWHHRSVLVHTAGVVGAGVTIAVVDTGADADMAGSGRPHACYRSGAPGGGHGLGGSRLLQNVALTAFAAEDALGHGTAVAAIAAAERWNQSPTSSRAHAPAAEIQSYAIALDATGVSDDATLIRAWQRVAADRARLGTRVAVNAYTGSPDPAHPVQRALDACALQADVL